MAEVVWEDLAAPRVLATLLALFAATALLLGAVGIYGVMANAVGERTRELSIRVALGAPSGNVLRTVLRDAMQIVLFGLGAGIAIAIAATRFLETQVFDVSPRDPWVLVGVSVVLTLVAALAAIAPALRAERTDPMSVLRAE